METSSKSTKVKSKTRATAATPVKQEEECLSTTPLSTTAQQQTPPVKTCETQQHETTPSLAAKVEHDRTVAEKHVAKTEEEVQEMAERAKKQVEASKEKALGEADTQKDVLKQQADERLRAEHRAAQISVENARERFAKRKQELDLQHKQAKQELERAEQQLADLEKNSTAAGGKEKEEIEKRVEALKEDIRRNSEQAKLEAEDAVRESVRLEDRQKTIMTELSQKVGELSVADQPNIASTGSETTSVKGTDSARVPETETVASCFKRPEDKPWTESVKEVFTGPSVPSDKVREARSDEVGITDKIKEFFTGTPAEIEKARRNTV